MSVLTDLKAKVQASQAAVQDLAQRTELSLTAHNSLLSDIDAAIAAVPTIADLKALVERMQQG
jgi:hypothetical protein